MNAFTWSSFAQIMQMNWGHGSCIINFIECDWQTQGKAGSAVSISCCMKPDDALNIISENKQNKVM